MSDDTSPPHSHSFNSAENYREMHESLHIEEEAKRLRKTLEVLCKSAKRCQPDVPNVLKDCIEHHATKYYQLTGEHYHYDF